MLTPVSVAASVIPKAIVVSEKTPNSAGLNKRAKMEIFNKVHKEAEILKAVCQLKPDAACRKYDMYL